jgi:hypothetical protein
MTNGLASSSSTCLLVLLGFLMIGAIVFRSGPFD